MHNALLRRAIEHDPTAITERTLVNRFLEAAPEFANIDGLEDLPIYRFFSSIETTLSPPERGPGVLTPHMLQPNPLGFWSPTFAVHERPEIILLYGQNDGEATDGGLFLNLQSCRVVWHWAPGPFPADEQWIALDFALQKSLDNWNSGKYFWDAAQGIIDVRLWTDNDVTDALSSWERLLNSIEQRLPQPAQRRGPVPLDQETRTAFRISPFAAEFLSRAPRPGFTFVAPGITTFSADSLTELYASESQQAARRSNPTGAGDPDGDEWASLVLPATRAVAGSVPRQHQDFDRAWGFGKFTLARRAGLYIIAEVSDAAVVRLINPSGLTDAGDFTGRCPWGDRRPPRLAEILAHWASLVESGTWAVSADGVADADDWFDGHLTDAKLSWNAL